MLTLSERWFTTQISLLVRAATDTGSRPTGTEPEAVRPPAPTSKISSVLSGVLTTNNRVPSGESASGLTCPLSKATNEAAAGATERTRGASRTSRRRAARFSNSRTSGAVQLRKAQPADSTSMARVDASLHRTPRTLWGNSPHYWGAAASDPRAFFSRSLASRVSAPPLPSTSRNWSRKFATRLMPSITTSMIFHWPFRWRIR